MIQIDKDTKEKRNAEYNKKARKYPAYLSLAIPIILWVAMDVKDITGVSMWIKGLTYLMSISAISIESRQRLNAHKPLTLGQASRIPGMRPADITVLSHWLSANR